MVEPLRLFLPAFFLWAFVLAPLSPAAEIAVLRDPTLPLPTAFSSTAGRKAAFDPDAWKLTSTLVGSGRAVAVINERIVGPGDYIDGARVVAIEPGWARLRLGGRVWLVHEIDNDVKKRNR